MLTIAELLLSNTFSKYRENKERQTTKIERECVQDTLKEIRFQSRDRGKKEKKNVSDFSGFVKRTRMGKKLRWQWYYKTYIYIYT